MGIQDRRSPETGAAAGIAPDDRTDFARKAKRRVIEGYQETHAKSSGSISRHEGFIQTINAALKAGDTGLWVRVIQAAKELLTEEERASWTFAGLRSLEPDMREITIEHTWFDASRPPPLLDDDIMAEARLRAVATTTREHKATMAATWDVLGESDRQGFLGRVVGREGLIRFIRGAAPATLDVLGLAVAKAMTPARWSGLVEHMKKVTRHGP